MGVNLKSEEEVKEYLKNLGTEYKFGCHHEKKPEVCHLLGDYFEAITKEFSKAADEFQKNCDERNYPLSCRKFGGYAIVGKGRDKTDPQMGLKYYEKGCSLGDTRSCFNQGIVLTKKTPGIDQDVPKGIEYLQKACYANHHEACHFLSGIFIGGIKKHESDTRDKKATTNEKPEDYIIQKNMEEAFKYAKIGCELKNMYACANLSQMYTRGDGTEKNIELGAKFKEIAFEIQKEVKNRGIDFQRGL